MISIELADFPAQERANVRKLLAKYRFSPAEFSIYAAIPDTGAANLNARIIHVEHFRTKQKREYPAASGQNWLDSFAKDLRVGIYTPDRHI